MRLRDRPNERRLIALEPTRVAYHHRTMRQTQAGNPHCVGHVIHRRGAGRYQHLRWMLFKESPPGASIAGHLGQVLSENEIESFIPILEMNYSVDDPGAFQIFFHQGSVPWIILCNDYNNFVVHVFLRPHLRFGNYADGPSYPGAVICNTGKGALHLVCYTDGSDTKNLLPIPGSDSAHVVPLCFSTIFLTMESPSPSPALLAGSRR